MADPKKTTLIRTLISAPIPLFRLSAPFCPGPMACRIHQTLFLQLLKLSANPIPAPWQIAQEFYACLIETALFGVFSRAGFFISFPLFSKSKPLFPAPFIELPTSDF
ncbi:MAG: hypothetical protein RRC34_06590 [Lentisphaeria bacterium]|nr:hypothetical protein [Lentisphaeria bacterium]